MQDGNTAFLVSEVSAHLFREQHVAFEILPRPVYQLIISLHKRLTEFVCDQI
jgi:hypothetical protein